MATYQGHASKAAWNVSLYINNEEALYFRARDLTKRLGRAKAAAALLAELPDKTPDGFRYSYRNVYAALDGILS